MRSASPGQAVIGRLGAEDLSAVLALTHLVPEAPWWNEAHVQQLVALPDTGQGAAQSRRGWVATVDGAVRGFLVLQILRIVSSTTIVECEIESVVVHPESRRRGLAHALLATTLGWCREHAVSVIRLEVRSHNMPAIQLYQHAGFGAIGTRRQYYQSPVDDAILMELRFAHSPLTPGRRSESPH